MKYELQDKLVLVHPELTNDPAEKQNQIGKITGADLICDNIIVDFEDGAQGIYAADALLVLMLPEELYQMFIDNTFKEPSPGLDALIKIDLLISYGSPGYQLTALELARKHAGIQSFCLDTLENMLAANKSQFRER
jgi:hypothetical protein